MRAIPLPPVRRRKPGFATLLEILVSQQLSAHAARAIIGRLQARVDPLNPVTVLALTDEELRKIGLSHQKIRYARSLCEDILTRRLDLEAVAEMNDKDATAHLIQGLGIGNWTADIYLLFALGRPDIWPMGDLAVRASAQRLKRLKNEPSPAEMRLSSARRWVRMSSSVARRVAS